MLVLAALATACTRAADVGVPPVTASVSTSASPSVTQASAPTAFDASSLRTRWPIKHVVFLIKENRTFDNLFGTFPGADGARVGMDRGVQRPLVRGTDQATGEDIPHCYPCALAAWNGGRMDGFNQTESADRWAYTQLHRDQLPNYWHWATHNVLFDDVFASAQGPSFPNHLFTIAAQSGGAHDNPRRPPGLGFAHLRVRCAARTARGGGGFRGHREEGAAVLRLPHRGRSPQRGEGPRGRTTRRRTNQKGYIWSAYSAIRRYREHPERWGEHMHAVDTVVRDIRDDALPPITLIMPRFELSEHPEYDFCHGENWSTQVIDAIMRSPMWKDTAIFLTWDDYGGFYDHVPPPQVDDFGIGTASPCWC